MEPTTSPLLDPGLDERPRSLSRAALLVVPALMAANVLNYGYTIAASRLLGPAAYGALGGLLALVLAGTVPGLALQAVVARHTAIRLRERDRERGRGGVAGLWAGVLRAVVVAGAALALATVAAGPLLASYLHLGSLAPTWWLAANLAPMPALFAISGMLQGEERFAEMVIVQLSAAAGKLVAGIGLVLAGLGVEGALAGAAAGTAAGGLLGYALVRARLPGRRGLGGLGVGALGGEVGAALLAVLGLVVLANLDVVLARHYLPATASGLYAAGSIIAKVAYWAPQSGVTLVFPRVAASSSGRRLLALAALATAAFGALCVAVAALASHAAAVLPFGSAYAEVGPALPLFAALGSALALANLVLFSGIAVGGARISWLLALAVPIEALLVCLRFHHSVTQIVTSALASVVVALVVGSPLAYRRALAPELPR